MQHAEPMAAPRIGLIGNLAGAAWALFAGTVMTGAFLLFAVEPMFAKMLLPLFGGSPAVWNTALVFFQVTLLAGYGYAHVLQTRFSPIAQVAIHCLVAAGVFVLLPIHVPAFHGDPASAPILSLLGLAAIGVGLPFFVLAANSSLVQAWYVRSARGASNPYVLFAASNFGSMLALVAYPLAIEPNMGLRLQSGLWGMGYALFAFQLLGCAVLMLRSRANVTTIAPAAELASAPISKTQIARWVALAALPASLMLGVTTHLEDAVASMPLLWALPLALYLLTFVFAFGFSRFASRDRLAGIVPYALIALVVLMASGSKLAIEVHFALHLGVFFAIALYCHATLYAERPPETRLTQFYLWLAAGGALGGIFNALIAPQVFAKVLEYPIALVAVAFFLPQKDRSEERKTNWVADLVFPALLAAGLAAVAIAPHLFDKWLADDSAAFTVAGFVALSFLRRPVRFALAVAAITGVSTFGPAWLGSEMLTVRNFFGAKHVTRSDTFHSLVHGGTLHGTESTLYGKERLPLSYYGAYGPLGDVFRYLGANLSGARIAVTGVGAGTTACYALPGQTWTFYDIDPQVVDIAKNPRYFRYLSTCAPNARIVLGDARLSLAREGAGADALMILDAYSSDQVPLHLITKEAFDVYLAALAPHGAIAVHVSNRYFTLSPILANIADAEGIVAFERVDDGTVKGQRIPGLSASDWVVIARDARDLRGLASDPRWHRLAANPAYRLWTDDYSSEIRVLRPLT